MDTYRTVCIESLGATYGDGKGGAAPPMCTEIDVPYEMVTEAGGEAWAFPAPGASAWVPAPLSGASVRVHETSDVLPDGVMTVPGVVTHSGTTSTPFETAPPDVPAVSVPASGLLLAGVMCVIAAARGKVNVYAQ